MKVLEMRGLSELRGLFEGGPYEHFGKNRVT
jgi:hypothetical protein